MPTFQVPTELSLKFHIPTEFVVENFKFRSNLSAKVRIPREFKIRPNFAGISNCDRAQFLRFQILIPTEFIHSTI